MVYVIFFEFRRKVCININFAFVKIVTKLQFFFAKHEIENFAKFSQKHVNENCHMATLPSIHKSHHQPPTNNPTLHAPLCTIHTPLSTIHTPLLLTTPFSSQSLSSALTFSDQKPIIPPPLLPPAHTCRTEVV